MKRNKIIMIIFLLLIVVVTSYLYGTKKEVLEIKEIDIYLTVANYTGFNIDTNAIFFGSVMRGGTVRRIITINNYYIESKVFTIIGGDLKKWVSASDDNFIMYSNESKNITVTANIPQDAEFGDYEGKLKILFKRAR